MGRFLINPLPSGRAAMDRLKAYAQISAPIATVFALVLLGLNFVQTRDHVVLSRVVFAGNLAAKLANQPLSTAGLQQELLIRLQGIDSPRETFKKSKEFIAKLDFFADIQALFWTDEMPYRTGKDFLAPINKITDPFTTSTTFGASLPGVTGEIKVFDAITLNANELQRWFEQAVLHRDLATLQIYTLGGGLIASVTSNAGKSWQVTEHDAFCLEEGLQTCQRSSKVFASLSITQRLGKLISALATRMTTNFGSFDSNEDWIAAAQIITAMREYNSGSFRQQKILLDRAQSSALLALQDTSSQPVVRYMALVTAMASYLEGIQIHFGKSVQVSDLNSMGSPCGFLDQGFYSSTKSNWSEQGKKAFAFFSALSEDAAYPAFNPTDLEFLSMTARLEQHASIRRAAVRACALPFRFTAEDFAVAMSNSTSTTDVDRQRFREPLEVLLKTGGAEAAQFQHLKSVADELSLLEIAGSFTIRQEIAPLSNIREWLSYRNAIRRGLRDVQINRKYDDPPTNFQRQLQVLVALRRSYLTYTAGFDLVTLRPRNPSLDAQGFNSVRNQQAALLYDMALTPRQRASILLTLANNDVLVFMQEPLKGCVQGRIADARVELGLLLRDTPSLGIDFQGLKDLPEPQKSEIENRIAQSQRGTADRPCP